MNFENAVVYRIVCKDPEIKDCYVGSTTNFTKRKCQHKHACLNGNEKLYNLFVYKFIRDHGGWDNWTMIEHCKIKVSTKKEMLRIERTHFEEQKATLNKIVPSRTDSEYRNENKDKIAAHDKQYYQQNREYILTKAQENREKNKDVVNEQRKQSRLLRLEQARKKDNEYYHRNKERIAAQCKKRYDEKKAEKASNNQTQ